MLPGTTSEPYENAAQTAPIAEEAARRIAHLQRENDSLAEEVLRNYEQLSVIFDFAQQAAQRTRTTQIEEQLLAKLHEQLQADQMHVWDGSTLHRHRTNHGSAFQPDEIPEQEMRRLLEGELDSQVTVRTIAGQRVLIAPLPGGGAPRRLIAGRLAPRGDFTAVEVRLAESLIAFAGSLLMSADMHARLRSMSIESTRALVAAIEKKDRYTSGHSARVRRLSAMIAVYGTVHGVTAAGTVEGMFSSGSVKGT